MSLEPIRLGCLLRAHRRANTLDLVIGELLGLGDLPGFEVRISCIVDRPSDDVQQVLHRWRAAIDRIDCPFPLLSRAGQRFMEASNLSMAAFDAGADAWEPTHIFFGDDDYYPARPHAYEELPKALRDPDTDIWYMRKIFFEGSPTTFNPHREHTSVHFFRYQRGDRFPNSDARIIQATENVHDTAIIAGRATLLRTPLLDYGTYTASERLRIGAAYREAGKIDAMTTSYVAESPALSTFPADAVKFGWLPDSRWHDAFTYHEALFTV